MMGAAFEQLGAQFGFEQFHLLGKGRLCHVEFPGSCGDLPFIDNGQKILQLLEVHSITISFLYKNNIYI